MPQEPSKNQEPSARQDPDLAAELHRLDAETAEEIDALELDLDQDDGQDDEVSDFDDGTGRIDDDIARERIEELTEVGPDLEDKGVFVASPGRDDTSDTIRRHHPNTGVARAEDLVEGNIEQPGDEALTDRKIDEGTAA